MKKSRGAKKPPNSGRSPYRCVAEHRITSCNRPDSPLCVIAIHGGGIEPGTTELARDIAGLDFSFYSFEGTKKGGNWENFHPQLESEKFAERIGVALVKSNAGVVSIHGLKDKGNASEIYVGGLDEKLKSQVIPALIAAEFSADEDKAKEHSGRNVHNICNRGWSGKGLQLEITYRLRKRMFEDLDRKKGREITTPHFARFVNTIRTVLLKSPRPRR